MKQEREKEKVEERKLLHKAMADNVIVHGLHHNKSVTQAAHLIPSSMMQRPLNSAQEPPQAYTGHHYTTRDGSQQIQPRRQLRPLQPLPPLQRFQQ